MRIAVLLMVGFVALAEHVGLETILGAFIAGALLNALDKDTATHPNFRLKLEAVGYGFVIPVFFVTSGLRFDLQALLESPSAFLRVPLFLLAILLVRGAPALLYRSTVGPKASAAAAGLLQATTLPLLVTAADIGVTLGAITPVTAAALISAGLLSVLIFPLVALGLLAHDAAGRAARVPYAPRRGRRCRAGGEAEGRRRGGVRGPRAGVPRAVVAAGVDVRALPHGRRGRRPGHLARRPPGDRQVRGPVVAQDLDVPDPR